MGTQSKADLELDASIQGIMDEKPKITPAVKNYFAKLLAEGFCDVAELQALSRELVQRINAFVMPTPPQWGLTHPQGENQSALDRIEQITKYKVLHKMREMALGNNGKPTELFGKTLLDVVFGDIKANRLKEICEIVGHPQEDEEKAKEDRITSFWEGFDSELTSVDSIVWAEDFAGALRKRQEQRSKEIKERVEKQV
jgi:hypothetical protein